MQGQPQQQADDLQESVMPAPLDPLEELLSGRVSCVEFSGGRVFVDAPRPGRVYLPGSFNPLHDGHRWVGLVASLLQLQERIAVHLRGGVQKCI